MWRCRCSMKRVAAITRLLQDADVGTRQLRWSSKYSSSRRACKTELEVNDPGAVQQETIVFCFVCIEPTGRKQPLNWSDSGRSSQESSVQPELVMGGFWNMISSCVLQDKTIDNGETKSETSVGWRTPSVDTSTMGKDSMVRSVQVPTISNPSKSEGDLGRLCTCLHCCNCETWRGKHNSLRIRECWICWTAKRLWEDDELAQVLSIFFRRSLAPISSCSFQSSTCSALDLPIGQCSMSHYQS